MRLNIILFSLFIYACTAGVPAEPECTSIDYEGNADWYFSADTLFLSAMRGDFIGSMKLVLGTETDSGRVTTGQMTGTFKPALGDNSEPYTRSGKIEVAGMLTFKDEEYGIMLDVISGSEGFVGMTGYFESFWNASVLIYYGGTFCL